MNEINTRLELFRTMQTSVRGSLEHLIVGIDIAKSKHHAFIGTPNGKTLRKNFVFDNTTDGFDKLRALVKDLQTQQGLQEVVYGVEPTASYHKPLAERGWTVSAPRDTHINVFQRS